MTLLTPEIRSFVDRQKLGFVATVTPDGAPNLSPKGTVVALDKHSLAFANIRSPQTIENLRHNPAAEVNVVDFISRAGFRFRGTCVVLRSGPRFEEIVARLRSVGARTAFEEAVSLTVSEVRPIRSPSYDDGTQEQELRERWLAYYSDRP